MENIYYYNDPFTGDSTIYLHNLGFEESAEQEKLLDIFANHNLPNCYFKETFKIYSQLCDKLLKKEDCLRSNKDRLQCRISRAEIMAFSIYYVMVKNRETPRTPQEILKMVNLPDIKKGMKNLQRIEHICSSDLSIQWNTEDFVYRYCAYLNLSYR